MDERQRWVQARISELRGDRRLGYAEIARKAGVSKQYLHQVARGAPPSDRLIAGMVKAFGLTPPGLKEAKPIVDSVKAPVPVSSTALVTNEDRYLFMLEGQTAQNQELTRRLLEAWDRIGELEARLAELESRGRARSKA